MAKSAKKHKGGLQLSKQRLQHGLWQCLRQAT